MVEGIGGVKDVITEDKRGFSITALEEDEEET